MVKKPLVVEAPVFGMILHLLLYREPIGETGDAEALRLHYSKNLCKPTRRLE